MTRTDQERLTLTVSRVYGATRERVFDAWTDPETLKQWFSPEGMTNPEVDVDLRAGGAYRVVMEAPSGARHVAVGTYREVARPEKLVFTWQWEGEDGAPHGETLVTVTFRERGDGTEVVLSQEGFPTEASRADHEKGWTSSLTCLDAVV